MSKLSEKYIDFLMANYDYTFLSRKIVEAATNKKLRILCVGSSYSLFGIIEKKLKHKAINLSLPSQDLYYAYKIAERVVTNNDNIKYCIIGCSYYRDTLI